MARFRFWSRVRHPFCYKCFLLAAPPFLERQQPTQQQAVRRHQVRQRRRAKRALRHLFIIICMINSPCDTRERWCLSNLTPQKIGSISVTMAICAWAPHAKAPLLHIGHLALLHHGVSGLAAVICLRAKALLRTLTARIMARSIKGNF